jgi:glycosyltransferase involved in cell wall biosynthesis
MRVLYIFSKSRDFKDFHNYPSALYFGYNDFRKDPLFETDAIITNKKTFFYYIWRPFELILYKFTGIGFALDRIILILNKINCYDVVVAVNDSCGLPLGLLKIFGIINPKIIVISAGLINNLDRMNFRLFLKPIFLFYKSILKKIDKVFLWSYLEVESYKKNIGNNCDFLPLEIDKKFWEPKTVEKTKFVLSVGRDSGRDFETIAKATSLLGLPLVVVTNEKFSKGLRKYPKITIITEMIPYQDLKNLYAQAVCVVVGIIDNGRISGQTSFVEGLASIKPVIAAGTKALISVYGNKNTGALFYEPKNSFELSKKIESVWKNKKIQETIKLKEMDFLKNEKVFDIGATYKIIKQSIQYIFSKR